MARREPISVSEETSIAQEEVKKVETTPEETKPEAVEKKEASAPKSKNGGCLV